jgi:hypothetical protein
MKPMSNVFGIEIDREGEKKTKEVKKKRFFNNIER